MEEEIADAAARKAAGIRISSVLPELPAMWSPQKTTEATTIILPHLDENRTPPYEEGIQPGKKPRIYYHDSTEEARLEARLESARKSANKAEVRKARKNLKAYWKKIIDEDYGGMIKELLPGEIKELMGLYTHDPYDILVQYRLHTLAVRAGKLGYIFGVKEIEWIINGSPLKSSPTGKAIADFAKNRAQGDGYHCFEYVARALSSVGIHLYGEAAFMATNQLTIHPLVREIKGLNLEQLLGLPQGVIVVWNRSNDHIYGHISISLGNGQEVSDKVRDQIIDYGTPFRVFALRDMMNAPVGAAPVDSIITDAHTTHLQILTAGDSVTIDKILRRGISVNIQGNRYKWQLMNAIEP